MPRKKSTKKPRKPKGALAMGNQAIGAEAVFSKAVREGMDPIEARRARNRARSKR